MKERGRSIKKSNKYIEYEDGTKIFLHEDDVPELTDEQFKTVSFLRDSFPELAAYSARKKAGRPKVDAPKKSKSFKLSQDLIAAIVASGKGYNSSVEAMLREGLAQGKI